MKQEGIQEGTLVVIEPVPDIIKKSHPASKITRCRIVKLMEYAPNYGTLDVLDVVDINGNELSIYDFQIYCSLNRTEF